ncbi:hypothetical protein JKP88DRAFT_347293 [Tribonema minus]|uniref:Uncharacterized protein n=1 Tax=Tribonema minus TaxID=303371 RepID=A0A836CPC5_9STRA|nr:hypothetical protein JKP88DRAFT_347293 [Tribonema minus]
MKVAVVAAAVAAFACSADARSLWSEQRELAATEAPTMSPSSSPTVAPTSGLIFPEDTPKNEVCVQGVRPPGVKPGACMQVMCVPKAVEKLDKFHTTVRFCLQRPRKWHLAFGLLDMKTKAYLGGEGFGIVDEEWQCAEHTFEHVFLAPKDLPDPATTKPYPNLTPSKLDLMWKFFAIPNWGTGADDYVEDTFPNMLAEAGIDIQPNYLKPLTPEGDCPIKPTRFWNLPPTGEEDGINFSVIPPCLAPGEEWTIVVDTHIESVPMADLHVNMQIGSGGDVYLGDADVYVTESDIFGLDKNTPGRKWTQNVVTFTKAQTKLVTRTDKVYLATFLVRPNSQYNKKVPGGWHFIDREFYLKVEFCAAGETSVAAEPRPYNTPAPKVEVTPAPMAAPLDQPTGAGGKGAGKNGGGKKGDGKKGDGKNKGGKDGGKKKGDGKKQGDGKKKGDGKKAGANAL